MGWAALPVVLSVFTDINVTKQSLLAVFVKDWKPLPLHFANPSLSPQKRLFTTSTTEISYVEKSVRIPSRCNRLLRYIKFLFVYFREGKQNPRAEKRQKNDSFVPFVEGQNQFRTTCFAKIRTGISAFCYPWGGFSFAPSAFVAWHDKAER